MLSPEVSPIAAAISQLPDQEGPAPPSQRGLVKVGNPQAAEMFSPALRGRTAARALSESHNRGSLATSAPALPVGGVRGHLSWGG